MKKNRSYRTSTIPDHAVCVFEGVIFDVYQWEQELFDGTKAVFERVARPDTIVVFPILEDGRIMLIKDEQPGRGPLLGAPAGRVEEGESHEACAARELLEETGLQAARLVLHSEIDPVLKLDWRVYTYIAHGCKRVADPKLDPGEKITEYPVTFEELLTTATERDLDGSVFRNAVLEARLDPVKMEALKRAFGQA